LIANNVETVQIHRQFAGDQNYNRKRNTKTTKHNNQNIEKSTTGGNTTFQLFKSMVGD